MLKVLKIYRDVYLKRNLNEFEHFFRLMIHYLFKPLSEEIKPQDNYLKVAAYLFECYCFK